MARDSGVASKASIESGERIREIASHAHREMRRALGDKPGR
jgi:hypothetical protein